MTGEGEQGETASVRERRECVHILGDVICLGLFDIRGHSAAHARDDGRSAYRWLVHLRCVVANVRSASRVWLRLIVHQSACLEAIRNAFTWIFRNVRDLHLYK